MGQATIANVIGTEMERVVPTFETLFERDDTFFSYIQKRPVEVIGDRDLRVPLEISPGGQFGMYNSDGGALGLGSGSSFDKAVINTDDYKLAVQWTARSQWVTDDKR